MKSDLNFKKQGVAFKMPETPKQKYIITLKKQYTTPKKTRGTKYV